PGLVKRLVNQHSCVRYCTIDSFDQFINSLFACSLSQEAGASLTVEPELSAVRTQFVAHKSGLLKLKEDIANAVERFGCPIILISGLPGVGKTTVAQRAARELKVSFPIVVEISAKNKPFSLVEFLDQCCIRLQISRVGKLGI